MDKGTLPGGTTSNRPRPGQHFCCGGCDVPLQRYHVFSVMAYSEIPTFTTPAGRYASLDEAKAHCESVTYRMAVIDVMAESRDFIYCNW